MSRVPHNALVVIADGGKALFLRAKSAHGEAATTLQELDKMVEGAVPLQGPSGSRPEDQSVKETNEASFALAIAKKVEALSHGGDAGIVIAADPQTLGQIRGALGKSTADRVAFTLAKDLTNHSLPDIARALH